MQIFTQAGYKVLETGIEHGTISVIINNTKVEITTLRRDITCDGRKANVVFCNDWKQDAARRDFTINAMSMDINGKIYDYFNGHQDLTKKIVSFVGKAELRIKEDFLRILRYFRFCSLLGYENINIDSYNACIRFASNLLLLSSERIKAEMFKLITLPYALDTLKFMCKEKILQYVHLNINYLPQNIKLSLLKDEPIVNWSAILAYTKFSFDMINQLYINWKLSKIEKKLIMILCLKDKILEKNISLSSSVVKHQRLIFILDREIYIKYIKFLYVLEKRKVHKLQFFVSLAYTFILPIFPISGYDLMNIGFSQKELGEKLNQAKSCGYKAISKKQNPNCCF